MSNLSNSFLSSVNELIGHGDRANKFQVEIGAPRYTLNSSGALPENYSYICKNATIPGREITTTSVWHQGRQLVLRDVTTFTNKWSATFYNDETYSIRKFFEDWMFEIDRYTSIVARSGLPLINLYSSDIIVKKLNERQEEVIRWTLVHAFPTRINDVQLSKENSNVTEFEIEFSYSYWVRDDKDKWL